MGSQRAYSTLGSVAIVNFNRDVKKSERLAFAKEILRKSNSIKTVLEKSGNFKGRLRKQKTAHLAGIKTKEVMYRENGCVFRFNIDSTYFSPRLSHERLQLARQMKRGDEVLVLFAGVAPFPIVIAKNSKVKRVFSNELNREANRYAKENIVRNKLVDRVELLPGDAKKVCSKLQDEGKAFDVIVMTRPQLEDSFLEDAFKVARSGTRFFYYDFCRIEEKGQIIEKVKDEAKRAGVKIKIVSEQHAGEIAPYKIRYRIDFVVLGRSRLGGFLRLFRKSKRL